MRKPSRIADLYAWHRAALGGPTPPTWHDGEPQCGWYRTRIVKGGPWVAARIWCEREICHETGELLSDERLLCEVDGQRRNPDAAWLFLTPISKADYDALVWRISTTPAMAASLAPMDMTKEAPRP
jgi:hypothetical protein